MEKQEKEKQLLIAVLKLVKLHAKAGYLIRDIVSIQEKIALRGVQEFDKEDINGMLGNVQGDLLEMDTILQKLHLLTKK